MGLLQNGFRDKVGVFRFYGAGFLNGAVPQELVENRHLTGMQRNLSAGEGITSPLVGIPSGHLAPSAWSLPQKPGAMSAFTTCTGRGTLTGAAAAGRGIAGEASGVGAGAGIVTGQAWGNGQASGQATASGAVIGLAFVSGQAEGYSELTGSIFAAINIAGQADGSSLAVATGSMVFSMLGEAAGTCQLTGAMGGLLNMAGAASGTGQGAGAIVGIYSCSGAAFGAGHAEAGEMFAEGWLSGQGNGLGSCSVTPYAYGFMAGSTDSTAGELTADTIATAVWGYER